MYVYITHTHKRTHTVEYYSAIKKNNAIRSNRDGLWDDHSKWSKPGMERQISYDITYMWNQEKRYKWAYLQNRNRPIDKETNLWSPKGKECGRDGKLRVWD